MGIVLVHGGGFGASCWDRLMPKLRTPAIAVDLPGRGRRPADPAGVRLADFTDAVVDDITASGWPRVVLVGHSLAGLTLPRVAARIPERLAHLVFVSCTVPAHGQTCVDTLDPDLRDYARANLERGAGVAGPLDRAHAVAMFGNDLDEEQMDWMMSKIVPEAGHVMFEPADLSGLSQPITRTWIRLLQDATVSVSKQDSYVDVIGGADVVDVDAGHMAMISQPGALAAELDRIAATALAVAR